MKLTHQPVCSQFSRLLCPLFLVLFLLMSGCERSHNISKELTDQEQIKLNRQKMQGISALISSFYLVNRRLPNNLIELTECPQKDSKNCPWLVDKDIIFDIWGRPFKYTVYKAKRTYILQSLGADGEAGGTGKNEDHATEGASTYGLQ